MTKETLQRAMQLHTEIQEAEILLNALVHADRPVLVYTCGGRQGGKTLSVELHAMLVDALSKHIDKLKHELEAL